MIEKIESIDKSLLILSEEDQEAIYNKLFRNSDNKTFTIEERYKNPEIRKAYYKLTRSIIMKEGYVFVYEKIKELLKEKKEIRVVDLGVGEGVMWYYLLPHIKEFSNAKIHIVGVDISEPALQKLNENLYNSGIFYLETVKANIKELDDKIFKPTPDIVLSSLTLHHISYEDKANLIKRISNLNVKKSIIIEVDYNLEKISNLETRNALATILYKDVFESVRGFMEKEYNKEILDIFYDELIGIIKSPLDDVEEKYISVADWIQLFSKEGFTLVDIQKSFTGINNLWNIYAIEFSNKNS